MKLKKILLTASLATLATITLAACSGNKTKRNTVTPYGNLNLDETFATAEGDLKMTVGQYYTQLRKNGYSIKYLFNVPITHYSYEKPNEFKYTQFVYAFISIDYYDKEL